MKIKYFADFGATTRLLSYRQVWSSLTRSSSSSSPVSVVWSKTTMDSSGDENFFPGGAAAPVAKEKKANKRLSVERIYQKKTQLEHILLRPDTYIGSVQPVTEKMWIFDKNTEKIINKEIINK